MLRPSDVVGGVLVLLGIVLIPLPGPGMSLVFLGLVVLFIGRLLGSRS